MLGKPAMTMYMQGMTDPGGAATAHLPVEAGATAEAGHPAGEATAGNAVAIEAACKL